MTETITGTLIGYHPDAQISLMFDGREITRNAANISEMLNNFDQDRRKTNIKIQKLEQCLIDNHEDIPEAVLQEIADIFGIDLCKDVEVEVTVTFMATVSVPLSEISDFGISHYDVDASLDSLGEYDFDVVDCSINSIDYDTP